MRGLGIHEVSQKTGISAAALRMWEKRYHWPVPRRNDSGYRVYSPYLVDQLIRVKAFTDSGMALGEIIKDGEVYFPTKKVAPPKRPKYDFSKIPQPVSEFGKSLRKILEDAIIAGNWGKVDECKAAVITVRPDDRDNSVLAIIRTLSR